VLCSDGRAIQLSSDHKPNRPDESERIRRSGGFVGRTQIEAEELSNANACDKFLIKMVNYFRLYRYPYRVYPGGLAVSRSIGDLEIKNSGLIVAEPETIRRRLTVQDEFLILACDGLWDVMTNAQAVELVREFRRTQGNHPTRCAKHLVFEAYRRNSTDNVTAICVFFSVTD
jgi:serine/threonine protein phosphatase PrpC